MAADYVAELRSFQPEGPYFLGGFCLGGLLALEAAEQLTAAGQIVALVIMIQSIHPEAMDYKPNTPAFKRMRYQMQKRASLEWENLLQNPKGYAIGKARASVGRRSPPNFDCFSKNGGQRLVQVA